MRLARIKAVGRVKFKIKYGLRELRHMIEPIELRRPAYDNEKSVCR